MTQITKEDIREVVKEVVTAAIQEHNSSSHHDFVTMLMDNHKAKKERIEKIKTQVYGWAVIASIGYVVSQLGELVIKAIQSAINHWR